MPNVKVRPGFSGVLLPDGNQHADGSTTVLTEDQFSALAAPQLRALTLVDTAANLTAVNRVYPAPLQIQESDTGKVKTADGATAYIALGYRSVPVNTRTPAYLDDTSPSSASSTLSAAAISGEYGTRVGNTFADLGDSITANGVSIVTPPALESRAWYEVAAMVTDGRAQYIGQAAVSGFTTAQIIATVLPNLLAMNPLPAWCIVLCARNDVVNGVPFATTKANLIFIYDSLRQAGIRPIACTLTAQSGNTATQSLASSMISGFIRQYAMSQRMPLIDFALGTTDPVTNSQVTGWFADASHPNAVGAKNMGILAAATLNAVMPPFQPLMALSDTLPANDMNLVSNPLMLADTNADGLPDNFTLVPGTATFTTALAAATVPALGKFCTLTRTGGTGGGYVKIAASVATPTGHRVAVSLRVGSSGVEANAGGIYVRLRDSAGTIDLGGLNPWSADLPGFNLYYTEVVVPAGMTALNVWMGVASGVGTAIKIGQLSVVDLTAQGLV